MSCAPPGRVLSRRRVLAAGVGALTAAGLAGCASGSTPTPGPEPTDDVEIINGALDLEHLAIASYEAAIPHLGGGAAALARRAVDQERAHAATLTTLVTELRGEARQPPARYALRPLRGRSDALASLAHVENRTIEYYVDALAKVNQLLRFAVAGILGNEAEHLAVLRSELGLAAAPLAFVWGRP